MALSNFYWDASEPVDGTLIPDGPQAWRYLIGNVETLFGSEHHTFPDDSNVGAYHKPGSAVLLTGTTRPTTRLDTSAFDVNDNGRLFYDSDTETIEVLTAFGGPTWVNFGSLSAAHTWALLQTFTSGFTSTVAPTWTAGVVAKDIYVTAVDQAETGLVNLIRADSNDKSALPDGAVLEAATETGDDDRTIADKAYVDSSTKGDIAANAEFICKGWGLITHPTTVTAEGNISSVTNPATGTYVVNWDTNFGSANYAVTVTPLSTSGHILWVVFAKDAGSVTIKFENTAAAPTNIESFDIIAFGAQ